MRVRWLVGLGAVLPAAQVAQAVELMSVDAAQREAFADASRFDAVEMAQLDPTGALVAKIGAPAGWNPRLYRAIGDKGPQGWLIVDRVIGKTEAITFSLALDEAGAIRALEILDYRESHGGEIRLPAWRKQFIGKQAADVDKLPKQIRIIAGATLSCRHVTEGVARLLALYQAALRPAA